MKKKEFIDRAYEVANGAYTKKALNEVFDVICDTLVICVATEDEVNLPGVGKFKTTYKAPELKKAFGEEIMTKPHKQIRFKVSSILRAEADEDALIISKSEKE